LVPFLEVRGLAAFMCRIDTENGQNSRGQQQLFGFFEDRDRSLLEHLSSILTNGKGEKVRITGS
jgi:hypothetical protein